VQLDVVAATAAWSLGAALGRTELFRRTSPSIRSWPSAEEPDEIVERVMHRVNGLVGPSASARSEADLSAYDLMVESAYRIVHDPEYHVAEDCVQCLLELQAAGFAVSELLDEAW
jgi:hypothetical protein